MSYRVSIRKHALKELSELPKNESVKIIKAIDNLKEDPRPAGCKKLKGEQEYFWRIRVGNYRVLYKIEDVIKVVEVGRIGHRKDIYE